MHHGGVLRKLVNDVLNQSLLRYELIDRLLLAMDCQRLRPLEIQMRPFEHLVDRKRPQHDVQLHVSHQELKGLCLVLEFFFGHGFFEAHGILFRVEELNIFFMDLILT